MKKAILDVKISYCRCSKWNRKVSFQHLKQNLISNSTSNNTNTVNLSSINSVNVINGNYQNHLVLRKLFVKVVPSYQLYLTCSLMTFLINVINMESLLMIYCGGLFADDIMLCALTRSQLNKLLKFVSK